MENFNEEDIQLAIQQSIQTTSNSLITTYYNTARSSLPFPKLGPVDPADSDPYSLVQFGIFNQFHSIWDKLIEKYEAPSAICGYISMCLPLVIAQCEWKGISDLKEQLCNINKIIPFLEDSMKFVHEWRSKYILNHPNEFPTERSKKDYKRAWIANYEISDYLRNKISFMNNQVLFIRYNEVPEYDHATHEEKTRIQQEQFPFGGKKGLKADPASFPDPGLDSIILIESFIPKQKLQTPETALCDPGIRQWSSAVLDVNGHFLVGVPCLENGKKQIALFNTIDTDCLKYHTSALLYDLLEYKKLN